MKKPLLFLCHRIPYPPNKGDKIRSYQLLKYLSKHFNVYVGAFIDDPEDWQYIDKLNQECTEVFIEKLNPTLAKLKSLVGFFIGKALSEPYYYNRKFAKWVDETVSKKGIENVVVYSSSVAQFIEDKKYESLNRVIDFVDIDSDKWLQYSLSKSNISKLIYQREAKYLFEAEKRIVRNFDYATFVSSKEAELFKTKAPELKEKVGYYNNGVDSVYFNPELECENPFPQSEKAIVFTGAMDYWANVDAVKWFATEHFGKIREQLVNVCFYIVGSNPNPEVVQLKNIDGIHVTGRVKDIRPYLKYADIVVAPLRIARGIQNKVLEAMAMGKTVVTSPQAFEGIEAKSGKELINVQNSSAWVEIVINALETPNEKIGVAARERILQDYQWESNLVEFGKHLV